MLTSSQRRSLRGQIWNLTSIEEYGCTYVLAPASALQFLYRQGLIAGRGIFSAHATEKFFEEMFCKGRR